jgi:hypothetical protein
MNAAASGKKGRQRRDRKATIPDRALPVEKASPIFVASQKVVAKQSGKAAISFRLWVVLIQKLALAPAQATQKR